MKTKIAALALLLFAGAATGALAQEREGRQHFDREPDNASARQVQRDQPDAPRNYQRDDTPRERPAPPPAQPAAEARPAPQARPAPEAPAGPEARGGGERRGRGEGRGPDTPATGERPDRQGRDGLTGGAGTRWRTSPTPSTEPGADRTRRPDGDRQGHWDRNGGDRGQTGQWDGRRRDGDGARPDGRNRNGEGQWDGRQRDGDRNRSDGRNRNGDGRHWDGRGRDGQHRWDRGQFRPTYQSQHRYRGRYWRPPAGFYVHAWSFGEILPWGWYGPDYRILDWWSFGLPEPPPGCYWVRVGYDALLVDDFDGQVLQVVRLVFY